MTEQKRTRRTPRVSASARTHLDQMMRAKDDLDADRAERERRERDAFARYAEAMGRADDIQQRTDRDVAKLHAQVVERRAKGQRELDEVDAERGAALAVLRDLGRTPAELATITDLSAKKVRALIQRHRNTGNASVPATEPDTGTSADVAAEPEPTPEPTPDAAESVPGDERA